MMQAYIFLMEQRKVRTYDDNYGGYKRERISEK